MPSSGSGPTGLRFSGSPAAWAALASGALLLGFVFQEAIRLMMIIWLERPEYSHGILIPLLAAFLVWQRADDLEQVEFKGSWAGLALIAAGAMMHIVGKMATLYVLQQYALVTMIYGVVLAYTGASVFRSLWMPLLLLVFMIPLPEFLLRNFSAQMQLISSQIGVWFVRLFGISVFLEGNVIDLGQYKLQVAEACDGLRYLFPLMTLGFVMAYFFKADLWKRILLFLSSIPITILMNSFRIGVIGVTVEHWGVRMADGFLHEFQGWVVFMASTAIMFGVVILLSRIGTRRAHWRDLFAIDLPRRGSRSSAGLARTVPTPLLAAVVAIALYAAVVELQPQRTETIPVRSSFSSFPERLGPWAGRTDSLEPIYLDALKLSDYLLADFTRADEPAPVNLYVAWYDSQRAGQSAHSPRSCLPGGGWRIDELDQITLPGTEGFAKPLRVNRVLIRLGNERQLVYYWFQQRGRLITNEYLVKWYLFLDAIGRQRTDGGLVRLTTPLLQGEDPAEGDARLANFAAQAVPRLTAYVPE